MPKRRKPAIFSSRFLAPMLAAAFIPSLLLTVFLEDHAPSTWWGGDEGARTNATVWTFFVVYGVIGTVIVMAFRLGALSRQDKDELLAKWLRSKGFRERGASSTIAASTEPFGLEGEHRSELAYGRTLRGQEVALLIHLVDTGTAKSPEPRRYTVVAASGNGSSPVTTVAPRSPWGGLASLVANALGFRSQALESAAFNRRWLVLADDRAAAHAMVHSRVIERLMRPDARGIRVTWDGAAIMCVQKGNKRRRASLERRINLVVDLANLVPGFARSDGGATGSRSQLPVLAGDEAFTFDPLSTKIAFGGMAVAVGSMLAIVAVAGFHPARADVAIVGLLVVMLGGFLVGFNAPRIAYVIQRARRRRQR